MTQSQELLTHYKNILPIRAKSIISTIFGDIVLPFDQSIWLETLTQLVAPLGINDRLVRTSLFRLSDEDWVYGTRLGRKSYYQLSASALEQTQQAESVIYYQPEDSWDESWLLVFLVLTPVNNEARATFEQELKWMGFGAISKHIWAHPQGSVKRLENRIVQLGLESQVVCMKANNIFDEESGLTLDDAHLAKLCSPTDKIKQEYLEFIERFSVLAEHVSTLVDTAPARDLMALRILLIDQFRHIALRDPHLPKKLLAPDWPEAKARALCITIYQALLAGSNRYYLTLYRENITPNKNAADNTLEESIYLRRFTSSI